MIYGDVCTGIGAASVAWNPLGWKAAFYSEIAPFPRRVLQHHYPEVPLHGDFTTIGEEEYGAIDLLVGGTPCQDYSVAGNREGLGGKRGSLALDYVDLAVRKRARWFLWENVPGVFSTGGGQDFKRFLGYATERGYGFAYRVLDAQFFGVPQRRRRVFVVGYFGDWRPAAAVLFEQEGLLGDITPRRKKRQSVAGMAGDAAQGVGGFLPDVAGCLQESDAKGVCSDTKPGHLIPVAIPIANQAFRDSKGGKGRNDDGRGNGLGVGREGDPAHTLLASEGHAVAYNMAVRKFTPRERERLQGFPDDYTLIYSKKGKPAGDAPRNAALGNTMAVPVMAWLGGRIDMVEGIINGK